MYNYIKSVFKFLGYTSFLGISALSLVFLMVFIFIKCFMSNGNDFTIDSKGIVKGESTRLQKLVIEDGESKGNCYNIEIKTGEKALDEIDLNDISDKYIIYKHDAFGDSIIHNKDFCILPNHKYTITNHSSVSVWLDYTFTTDSLCRIDSIFHNTILIYPKRE